MDDYRDKLIPVPAGVDNLTKTGKELVQAAAGQRSGKELAMRKAVALAATQRYVPHVSLDDVRLLCKVAACNGIASLRERNVLIIQALFDSCLRVSELLAVRPRDIKPAATGYALDVYNSKKRRYETAAISSALHAKLLSYAYTNKIEPDERLFKINRSRVFQMVAETFNLAGIVKPDGVGTVHILRHSGALYRLSRTGNPQSIQEQLRHSSIGMTLRYMRTLGHDEAMAIQSQVEYDW